MKVCSIREGSCEVRYLLNRRIRGDESSITTFVDNSQSSIEVLARGSTQCQSSVVIWAIFVGIIVGTIILGIVIIVIWRLCTYLGVNDIIMVVVIISILFSTLCWYCGLGLL